MTTDKPWRAPIVRTPEEEAEMPLTLDDKAWMEDLVLMYKGKPTNLLLAKRSSDEIKSKIIELYKPYVEMMVKTKFYTHKDPSNPFSHDNMVLAGLMGLSNAVDKYNPNHVSGGSFFTYCVKFIEGRMRHYLRNNADDKKIIKDKQVLANVRKVQAQAEAKGWDKAATNAALAELLDIRIYNLPEKIKELTRIAGYNTSLRFEDPRLGGDDASPGTLGDTIEDPQNYERIIETIAAAQQVEAALAQLPEDQQMLIRRTQLQDPPASTKDIARELNISHPRFGVLVTRAMKNLEKALKGEDFPDKVEQDSFFADDFEPPVTFKKPPQNVIITPETFAQKEVARREAEEAEEKRWFGEL
jgi:RNA polymerase sigma factor (sigma-70 family)